jgi:translation initiation factor 1
MSNNNKKRDGFVFSTDPNFSFPQEDSESVITLEPSKQKLKIVTDSKMRAGKIVTIIKNFIGKENDLESLGKQLKSSCGVGGTVKDGKILLQGNFKDRVIDILTKKGYMIQK